MVEHDMACSPKMQKYFDYLDDQTKAAYELATKARKKGFDPEEFVEVKLAKNMAERVVGIISVVAPQIVGSGVTERIIDLEKQYGSQDWRVAFVIALEIAQEKYCTFKNKLEAIEVGVRTGFAYVTVGVVSSPLEGLTSIEIKKRRDGNGEYFRVNFAGPIRNAGGTSAAASVLIADYVRKHLGYAKYDPDEKEVRRCYAELEDYHQYVANLQYFPFKEETEFLLSNIPVEIAGDPSEKRELSNASLKDLPRIETNLLRSGYCLIHSSCIPLKAPKLWKKLDKWGHDMGMEDWDFLGEHIKLQKDLKAKSAGSQKKSGDGAKIKPDPTFAKDIVGGRPVLGHPMRSGAFRLRYGRSRASGLMTQSCHPATMYILNDLIAIGTQLKVERPGKGALFTPCDELMGPIVKTHDGSVYYLDSVEEAKKINKDVKEILYLGDALVDYGDFFDRAHVLAPPGYCEEYWALQVQQAMKEKDVQTVEGVTTFSKIISNPLITKVSYEDAKKISKELGVPMHPSHIFFYKEISNEELKELINWLKKGINEQGLISLELEDKPKRFLELIGVPHEVSGNNVLISPNYATPLFETLGIGKNKTYDFTLSSNLDIINAVAPFIVKDKSGLFIGARMGRPEKAKMRKLTGSPHGLFPVGEEGGRLRSFQSALEKKKVTSSFPVFVCPSCSTRTPFSICDQCETKTIRQKIIPKTKQEIPPEEAIDPQTHYMDYTTTSVPIQRLFDYCLKKLKTRIYPDLIKGVRGTVGKDHTPEHLLKAIMRAKYGVAVNKDGTVRYDASEITLTHFKPKEVGTSIERLKELGYSHDVYGKELVDENQVLELFVQDVVLPACPESPELGCDEILLQTTKFIDDMLVHMYGLKPFYKAKDAQDLVGHLLIGLAPHTSAGIVGRIVGFSQTQGLLAHPLYHQAMRRDCDGDESCIFLLLDSFLNFSKKFLGTSRGSTMDAPLVLTTLLNPAEVDDQSFNVGIVDHYPLEFYETCEAYGMPWDVKIKRIEDVLFKPGQFEGMMFTHSTNDINEGILCSDYKTLPSMQEKIEAQMDLAAKIRAVDSTDVARLVIEKHFIRDTKGNLRKFSLQQFRCVGCNEKFRRPPLSGKCTACGGKIIFTISEGSIMKYLNMSIDLAERFNVSDYLKETLYLTRKRITDVFGKEKEKQTGLAQFAS